MTREIKCFTCKQIIPVGKYHDFYKGEEREEHKIGSFCSPCGEQKKTEWAANIKDGSIIVKEEELKEEPPLTKTKLKLSGCQCSEKDKEFEVDLKDKSYDENKDLVACPQCQSLDQYSKFSKELSLEGEEVENKGHKLSVAIIYGAKVKDEEDSNNKCNECKKEEIERKITGTDQEGQSIQELNLCQACSQDEVNKWHHGKSCCREKGNSTKHGVTVSSDGSSSWKCSVCSFARKSTPTKTATVECDKCKKVVEPTKLHSVTNQRTKENWMACDDCYKCSQCKQKNVETIANNQSDKWIAGTWLCHDCFDNKPGNKKRDPSKFNKYTCKKCQISCYNQEKSAYLWWYCTHYYTDFTTKTLIFARSCNCLEEHKKENQQTCPQCNKTEWPDIDKGWMLDYNLKLAFCSSDCHGQYLEKNQPQTWQWYGSYAFPPTSPTDNQQQVEYINNLRPFTPQLEGQPNSSGNSNENFNLERDIQEREILYWQESLRELERQLEQSKNKPKNQQHSNEVPRQQRQLAFLRRLHQNAQRVSEKKYQSKYGKEALRKLKSPERSNNEPKPTNYLPWILGGIGIISVAAIAITYLLTKKKKEKIEI